MQLHPAMHLQTTSVAVITLDHETRKGCRSSWGKSVWTFASGVRHAILDVNIDRHIVLLHNIGPGRACLPQFLSLLLLPCLSFPTSWYLDRILPCCLTQSVIGTDITSRVLLPQTLAVLFEFPDIRDNFKCLVDAVTMPQHCMLVLILPAYGRRKITSTRH